MFGETAWGNQYAYRTTQSGALAPEARVIAKGPPRRTRGVRPQRPDRRGRRWRDRDHNVEQPNPADAPQLAPATERVIKRTGRPDSGPDHGHQRVLFQVELASGSSDSIRHHSWAYGSGTLLVGLGSVPVMWRRGVAGLPAVATAGGADYERDNEG